MFERSYKNQAKINLTPLIDIIFQLVIFFMLATTFVKAEALTMFVDSDEKAEAASQFSEFAQDYEFVIEVLGDKLVFKGEAVSENGLYDKISRQAQQNPNEKINIIASGSANVQNIVSVIDIAKKAGSNNISINSDN